jgi:hypothetical protein
LSVVVVTLFCKIVLIKAVIAEAPAAFAGPKDLACGGRGRSTAIMGAGQEISKSGLANSRFRFRVVG